jgi:hypothetical protein
MRDDEWSGVAGSWYTGLLRPHCFTGVFGFCIFVCYLGVEFTVKKPPSSGRRIQPALKPSLATSEGPIEMLGVGS